MKVLVTGAGGYIGRALARRLAAPGATLQGRPVERLTLVDLALPDGPTPAGGPRIERLLGSVADAAVLAAATADGPDVVFHLAGVTSGAAEADFALGLQVNLLATVALLERLRAQGQGPALVHSSSIAVFGTPLPPAVDDATPPSPSLSYGAHKQAAEILIADASRRGFVRGQALRLPGVVARPPAPSGALSAFSSELIRALAAGRTFTCPVSAQATLWLMSLPCCVDNLLHATDPAVPRPPPGTSAWTLPALRVTVGEVVAAFDGGERLVTFAPDDALEAQFGCLPPLAVPLAEAAGFRHDGDLASLLRRAVEDGAAC